MGLGLVYHDLVRNLPVDSFLAVPSPHGYECWLGERQMVATSPAPARAEIETYLARFEPDVLLSVEMPYSPLLFDICREFDIKTAYVPMQETYNPGQVWPDIYLCPNACCYGKVVEENKVLLRLPLDIGPFFYSQRTGRPRRFLHVMGHGIVNSKRQTNEVVEGFMAVPGDDLSLTVVYQVDPRRRYRYGPQDNPDPRIHWVSEMANIVKAYANADVLVQPDAYAGYERVLLEAQACGLPVITTDAPPMNETASEPGLLVPADRTESLVAGVFNAVRHLVAPEGVRAAIERICSQELPGLSARARAKAEQWAWTEERRREWVGLLEGLL